MAPGNELGLALRSWRERATPRDDTDGPRRIRRTPGLRREELAAQAGVSVDYLIRLEQGRATEPSEHVLRALARELQLSDEETSYVFALARKPAPTSGLLPTTLPPGIHRLLEQMRGAPLGIYDPVWNLLAWNLPFSALMGERSPEPGRNANIVWSHFNALPSPVTYDPAQQDRFERAIVADLRSAAANYPDDPRVADLISDLRASSRRFIERWDAHFVGEHTTSSKKFWHHEVGHFNLDCDVLVVPGGDLKLVMFTAPPDSVSAHKLELVVNAFSRELGAQDAPNSAGRRS